MKTIILISSIFYILGLKVSHKIDVTKNHQPVKKVHTIEQDKKHEALKSITLKEGLNLNGKIDSLQIDEYPGDRLLRSK